MLMPSTVKQLFDSFCIRDMKSVPWGTTFKDTNEGIYIVSLSPYAENNSSIIPSPSFSKTILQAWIDFLPDFTMDGSKPTIDKLKSRLSDLWIPDESILYIGKASGGFPNSGLGKRISDYYRTKIGSRSPHSGGQWIKTLSNISSLWIYYGYCEDSEVVEFDMLTSFMNNISTFSRDKLRDKRLPLPFANLEYKLCKNDGFKNQRQRKSKKEI